MMKFCIIITIILVCIAGIHGRSLEHNLVPISSGNEIETSILADPEQPAMMEPTNIRSRRSLSIVNPIEVLRQRLLHQIYVKRWEISRTRIMENEEMLKRIG